MWISKYLAAVAKTSVAEGLALVTVAAEIALYESSGFRVVGRGAGLATVASRSNALQTIYENSLRKTLDSTRHPTLAGR